MTTGDVSVQLQQLVSSALFTRRIQAKPNGNLAQQAD